MPSHRRKLLPLCIAASLLAGVGTRAAAIGVGDIHLQSFLGAPLQAEIPLNHLGELSVDQLKVQLGSQDDYGAMGVDYSYLHSQFKIEPIVKNGQGYVRISTREPVTEPYLNFVLNLRWPQGQLVREFTVLLDPPTTAVAAGATSPQPVATREPSAANAVVADVPASPSKRQPRPVAQNLPASQVPSEGRYTIQRGDSLWRIANRMHAPAPVEQVMAAILANNPGAFINGNPNLLKEAVTIALPDAQQIAAADHGVEAGSTVAAAGPAVTTAAPTTAQSVADAAPASAGVSALIEENSALKTQVNDLTSNVASLNENLAQSEQRLHQLESQLNELIQQMQQQRATVAAMRGNAESANTELVQSTGSVINQVNAADLQGLGKAHTPWWVHLLYWLGIGGAVTWAVREHFWPQRRLSAATIGGGTVPVHHDSGSAMARASTPAFGSRITTVQKAAEIEIDELEIDELPALDDAANAAIEREQSTPQLQRTVEPAPQLLRNNEDPVDPSISAGVFVAFGRFDEAETLLREALYRDPSRIDLKLQLLDVFMQSDQPGAFDDLAAEIEQEASTPETLAELAVLRDSYRR
ncbi:MAG: FimV/HubP family polar landmark protein [Spongiibacteraceae bacterium]